MYITFINLYLFFNIMSLARSCGFYAFKYFLLCSGCHRSVERPHSLERVRYAERLVFALAHTVIGQHVERLYIFKLADELSEREKVAVVIGISLDYDVSYPHGDIFPFKIFCKGKNALVSL